MNKKDHQQLLLTQAELQQNLHYLKLPFLANNYENIASQAGNDQWDHIQFLTKLIGGEAAQRRDRATTRRIRQARFPVLKTMDNFEWNWPKKINRPQVQNLFRHKFIEDNANIILLGGVGLGKTHVATSLAYDACLKGYSVLFATTIDVINNPFFKQVNSHYGKGIMRMPK